MASEERIVGAYACLERRERQIKLLLKGIRKIRDEITSSDGGTPRWVAMDLNALCNEFMDEKGDLK